MTVKSFLEPALTQKLTDLITQFVDRWNAKDLEGFGQLFTENAEFTDVVGQTAQGRKAIQKQHEFPFRVILKQASLELNELFLRKISAEMILVSGKWKTEGSQTPDGKPLPTRNGVIQLLCKQVGTDWKLQLVHNADNALPYERRDGVIKD